MFNPWSPFLKKKMFVIGLHSKEIFVVLCPLLFCSLVKRRDIHRTETSLMLRWSCSISCIDTLIPVSLESCKSCITSLFIMVTLWASFRIFIHPQHKCRFGFSYPVSHGIISKKFDTINSDHFPKKYIYINGIFLEIV